MSYRSITQSLRFRIGDTTKVGFHHGFGMDVKEYGNKLNSFPNYRHYIYELVSFKIIKRGTILKDIYCHVRSISGECGIDILIKHNGLRPIKPLEIGYADPIPKCPKGSEIELVSLGNSYPEFPKAREILKAPAKNNYDKFDNLETHKFTVVDLFWDKSEGFIYYITSDKGCHNIIGQEGIKLKTKENENT